MQNVYCYAQPSAPSSSTLTWLPTDLTPPCIAQAYFTEGANSIPCEVQYQRPLGILHHPCTKERRSHSSYNEGDLQQHIHLYIKLKDQHQQVRLLPYHNPLLPTLNSRLDNAGRSADRTLEHRPASLGRSANKPKHHQTPAQLHSAQHRCRLRTHACTAVTRPQQHRVKQRARYVNTHE